MEPRLIGISGPLKGTTIPLVDAETIIGREPTNRVALNDPLVSGYNNYLVDISALLLAHRGETLRLRFAEVDNLSIFNMGVDQIAVVPEPSAFTLAWTSAVAGSALFGLVRVRRRT